MQKSKQANKEQEHRHNNLDEMADFLSPQTPKGALAFKQL